MSKGDPKWATKHREADRTEFFRVTEELRDQLALLAEEAKPNTVPPPAPLPDFADRDESTTKQVISVSALLMKERPTLTVLAGVHAGALYLLDKPSMTIGRASDADIAVDDPALSRHHARVFYQEGSWFMVEDLRSKNGTLLNGVPVERGRLNSGSRIQLGPNLLLRFALMDERDVELHNDLYHSAKRDPLTGACNRRQFESTLAAEIAHAKRNGLPLSILMVDIDHFKQVNDVHGHAGGDEVLKAVATVMTGQLRAGDVLARYGGEEFVILSRTTSLEQATLLAERLRHSVELLPVPVGPGILRVTLSIGVAELSEVGNAKGDELVMLADGRLYRAKHAGRNRVSAS